MSWYKPENPKILVQQTPQKESVGSRVQVPSSSPIYINSSPPQADTMAPSIKLHVNEEKAKDLESKRQAIRNHKDFPIIRKRFHYLPENVIFKGFVKGKGNLKAISDWLNENFSRDEMLESEQQALHQRQREQQQQREAERANKFTTNLKNYQLQKQNEVKHEEEEDSPIKVRGKARTKTIDSPTSTQTLPQTTKVELKKPKMSILDKYKQRNIIETLKKPNEKKRKLVRLTSINDNIFSPPSKPSLLESFRNDEPEPLFRKVNGKFIKESPSPEISKSPSPEMDDLEILEARIRENRKNQLKKRKVEIVDSESDSDVMTDNEFYEANGLTSLDSQILEFLNTAEKQDLVEISNSTPGIIDKLIQLRPFNDIYQLSEEQFDDDTEIEAKKKKKRVKPHGLRIIENTEASLKGYRAVDSLVKKCSEVGSLISKQMEKWGVSVTGEGELEMVDLKGEDIIINDEDEVHTRHRKTLKYWKRAPDNFNPEFELKNYQIVGINWLNLLYTNDLSCILADEMGLGKTCQVIAFMAYLKYYQTLKGPHLVIVPSSTLENWLREFNKFCPDLVVQAYYGSQSEREELRYELRESQYDVLVTTYNLASGSSSDFKFLVKSNFDMIIYDEGHMLKNSNSERYTKLMRLEGKFRLLLTGTPLQNNLKELVSLLAFMLPKYFSDKREDLQGIFNQKAKTSDIDDKYNPLLSQQAISKAKKMMTPFVLRRKKIQVLKHLPSKNHSLEYCEMTPLQQKIYDDYMNQGKATRLERERRKLLTGKEAQEAKRTVIPSTSNVLMLLRKAAIHPLLFRQSYTDDMLLQMSKAITNEPEYADANQQYIYEDMGVMADYELNNLCLKFPKTLSKYKLQDKDYLNSGKVQSLIKMLDEIITKGEKVLLFSLFTQVLDILEKVLSILNYKFVRLDGRTSVENRQDIIDTFYEDSTIPIFLLSTRAGGFGINLVAANNVIIFDQSFNPHDDKQAEDRAHRVGQTKEVHVRKLITKGTIEENMLQLGENKLQLDQSLTDGALFEETATNLVERLLFGPAS